MSNLKNIWIARDKDSSNSIGDLNLFFEKPFLKYSYERKVYQWKSEKESIKLDQSLFDYIKNGECYKFELSKKEEDSIFDVIA